MLNFDYSTSSRYKERFLRSNQINSYYAKETAIDIDCLIGENTVINENVKILEKAAISNSIMESKVTVGICSKISDSYISHDTQIGNNSVLRLCRIGSSCKIGSGVKLTSVTAGKSRV